MRGVLLLVAGVLALTGCSSTGPKTSVNGTWSYSATNLVSGQVTCTVSGGTMVLTQTGSTFNGTYSNETLSCQSNGQQTTSNPVSGSIVNGTISSDNVSFDLDTQAYTNTGTISGGSMTGTATVTVNVNGTVVTLTGQFGASKQ